MLDFPRDLPRPEPSIDDAPFWEGCRQRRLMFQKCADCGGFRHPPTPVCPHCRSMRIAWEEAHGDARIYSYTDVHHPAHPAVRGHVPYVVVVIAFPAMDGVRLVSNLVGRDRPEIGASVELVWDDVGDGLYLPRFRLPKR